MGTEHKFTVTGVISNIQIKEHPSYGNSAQFDLKCDPVQLDYNGQYVPHDGEFKWVNYKCQKVNPTYTDDKGFPKYVKEGDHVLIDGILEGKPKPPDKIKDPATESRYWFNLKARSITVYGRTVNMPMNSITGCGQVEAAVHSEHGGIMMLMKEKYKIPNKEPGQRFYMVWSPYEIGTPESLQGKYLNYQGKLVKDLHPNSGTFPFSHRDRQPFIKADVIGG